MNRYEFLGGVHRVLRPRTYLEIGINDGRSLTLSRARSVAVDPAFKVTTELHCDLRMIKTTSDEFFARPDPVGFLPHRKVDFAFIDGMHLFEYALRDFIHAERYTRPTSVVVLDDMLPRSIDEAARDRHTDAWTGDVFKVAQVLEAYRPDLLCVLVDTKPTGQLVVFGLDASSTTLTRAYDAVHAQYVVPDPQAVPAQVLERRHAVDPEQFLASPFWDALRAARDKRIGRRATWAELRPQVEAAARAAHRPARAGAAAGA